MAVFALPFMLSVACDTGRHGAVMSHGKNPVLSVISPENRTIDLSETDSAEKAMVVEWTPADFGVPVGVSYFMNIMTADSSKHTIVTLTQKGKESITYKELGKIFIEKMQFPAGSSSELLVSICAKPIRLGVSESDNKIVMVSAPVKMKLFIPAGLSLCPAGFSLVGSMFEGGRDWDIDFHGYKFFRDKEADNIHKYIGKFKENSAFKIVPEEGFAGWSHVMGEKDGKLAWENAENITSIKKAGYYQLTLNPAKMTLDIKPYDATSSPEYNFVGLIGTAAEDWENDVLLTKTAYDNHIWVGENVTLSEGEIKFRADKAWKTSWGISTLTYGTAATETGNFAVTKENAGRYNVYFNDLTGWYIFEKIK